MKYDIKPFIRETVEGYLYPVLKQTTSKKPKRNVPTKLWIEYSKLKDVQRYVIQDPEAGEVIEFVFPDMETYKRAEEIIMKHNWNPLMGVMAQKPIGSYPDVSNIDEWVACEFALEELDDPDSSGFHLLEIVKDLIKYKIPFKIAYGFSIKHVFNLDAIRAEVFSSGR